LSYAETPLILAVKFLSEAHHRVKAFFSVKDIVLTSLQRYDSREGVITNIHEQSVSFTNKHVQKDTVSKVRPDIL
jgi:hypothetical protein